MRMQLFALSLCICIPQCKQMGSSQTYRLRTIQCRRPKNWIKIFCISLLSQGTQWSTGQNENEKELRFVLPF